MTFFDAVRSALLAGFGLQEKVVEFIDDLVKKGELSASQGAKLVREWSEKADRSTEQFSKGLSEIMSGTLERMSIPTKEDIEKLNRKIQTLSARVKKLEGGRADPARDAGGESQEE